MSVWRAFLFPLSIIYDCITRVRNHLYNIGHKSSFRFDTMVISVGNLNVGGSGKTPMVEYLIRTLGSRYKLATLSRGYGRRTKGFRIGSSAETATTLGDEPYQLFRKFGNDVTIAVGEERATAIPSILHQENPPDVIILDDAFQHRAVTPQFSILLTDYEKPFYTDFVLPAGNLRESRKGAKRSHAVVVTKCPPTARMDELQLRRSHIGVYAPKVPVFFTGIQYGTPTPFGSESSMKTDVVLVSGIAKSDLLIRHVQSTFTLKKHFEYRDHHRYTVSDLNAIHEFCKRQGEPVSILTTEKDMAKLIDENLVGLITSHPWFFVPIKMVFLQNGSEFDTLVMQSIEKEREDIGTIS